MEQYTLVITAEQKELIEAAIKAFSQLTVGQSFVQREAARKLAPRLSKLYAAGTNDLTQQ